MIDRDYAGLSKQQIKNLLAGFNDFAGTGSVMEPIIQDFTNETSVTIAHPFGTPFVTVHVFIENGVVWNELPVTSYAIQSDDTQIVVLFDTATTGIIKLSY